MATALSGHTSPNLLVPTPRCGHAILYHWAAFKLWPGTNDPLDRPVHEPQAKDACHGLNSLLARCRPRRRFPAASSRQDDHCGFVAHGLERDGVSEGLNDFGLRISDCGLLCSIRNPESEICNSLCPAARRPTRAVLARWAGAATARVCGRLGPLIADGETRGHPADQSSPTPPPPPANAAIGPPPTIHRARFADEPQ